VAAHSKPYVCCSLLAGIAGSNTAGGYGFLFFFFNVFCCHAEVSVTGRSLLQRNPTNCVCVCVSMRVMCNTNLFSYSEWIFCVLLLVFLCVLLLVVLCVLLLVVLCVLLSSYVYLLYYVCVAVFTLDAGLLARSQYSEFPATGHLDTSFSWFPCA